MGDPEDYEDDGPSEQEIEDASIEQDIEQNTCLQCGQYKFGRVSLLDGFCDDCADKWLQGELDL